MKTSLLLPNRYKKVGWLLFPFGLIIWASLQIGILDAYINHLIKVSILTLSFFSFLIGFYFVSFSKEPIEDEYISSLRLKSFQISAIIQMIYFLMAFTSMLLFRFEPNGDGGLASFLLLSILIYWLAYLIVFNITIIKNNNKLDA
jgi:predicted neutral ceramidase superfamily lipid hydrolase